ncbi:MAG: hypothetical protein AB7O04_06925 [Hyphomonadaceae bacterium]
MRYAAPIHHHPTFPAEAHLQSLLAHWRNWIAEIWMGFLIFVTAEFPLLPPERIALRRHLRSAHRDLKRVIYLMAIPLLIMPPPRAWRAARPRPAPPGFIRARLQNNMRRRVARAIFKRAMQGSLRQRLERYRAMLANPLRWAERLAKRMMRGFTRGPAFILVFSSAPALPARCAAQTEPADSS